MTNLVVNAQRVVRHSRRFYLVACGWCERDLGLPGAAVRCDCPAAVELLRQARERLETLGRAADQGPAAPSRGPRWLGGATRGRPCPPRAVVLRV